MSPIAITVYLQNNYKPKAVKSQLCRYKAKKHIKESMVKVDKMNSICYY